MARNNRNGNGNGNDTGGSNSIPRPNMPLAASIDDTMLESPIAGLRSVPLPFNSSPSPLGTTQTTYGAGDFDPEIGTHAGYGSGNDHATPWHGRHVYMTHYPDDYYGYRGFCSWPLAFWFFCFGFFFPLTWFVGTALVFSRNPYERLWAKNCLMAIALSLFFGIILSASISK